MILRKSIILLFLLLISISKGFSFGNEMSVEKDSIAGSRSIGICRDSVFSLRSKRGYIPSLIHNFGEQATAPFKMNTKQALMVGGAIAITGALFYADQDIDKRMTPLKENHEWIKKSSPLISELGGTYGFALVGAFGSYSIIFKDSKAFRTTLLATQAAITSGVWVRLGKMLAGRERPSATYNDLHHDMWWGPFQEFNGKSKGRGISYFDAFPSGHSSSAFAFASVFAHQYADKPFVPVFAYSMATLVGISRLTEHTHWASDVFAGACIGYLCGRQVVKHERVLEKTSLHASAKKMKSEYFFSMSGDQLTINCCMTF